MNHFKFWAAIALVAFLAVFAIQNMTVIEVSFLGMDFSMRRIFLILGSLSIGFILGKVIRFRGPASSEPIVESEDH